MNKARQPEAEEELMAAVNVVRSGQLDTRQREALAALLLICGKATLPTPIVAAVFGVVEACKRATRTKKSNQLRKGGEL
jgi:hypothetical protein